MTMRIESETMRCRFEFDIVTKTTTSSQHTIDGTSETRARAHTGREHVAAERLARRRRAKLLATRRYIDDVCTIRHTNITLTTIQKVKRLLQRQPNK